MITSKSKFSNKKITLGIEFNKIGKLSRNKTIFLFKEIITLQQELNSSCLPIKFKPKTWSFFCDFPQHFSFFLNSCHLCNKIANTRLYRGIMISKFDSRWVPHTSSLVLN